MNQEPIIRRARRDEADEIMALAGKEGWNPGINDAGIFYNADPDGFFIMDAGGEVMGCVSAVAYDEAFGFLGLYIMRPEYRGRGLGIQLWKTAMDYLGKRNIGLDGVVAQQDNYRKSGFVFAYNNIRYRHEGSVSYRKDDRVRVLTGDDTADVMTLDARMFPARREGFMKSWILQPGSIALGVGPEEKLTGYIVVRRCLEGYKAGPLFAESKEDAVLLWHSALSLLPAGSVVYLDIPQPNPHAMALVTEHGMTAVFETARMYNRGTPDIDLDHVYGVTSFELG